jgi:His/Glu/Gln/Arg/opine family amino acid ABC transporter permease subunit
MTEFGPLTHSFWYLLRGAGMTVRMATSAAVPATVLGVLLAPVQVFGGRLVQSAIIGYLFLIRGIPLLVLLTLVYYLMPSTGIDLPPFWCVVLVLSLYYAAFIARCSAPASCHCRRRRGVRRIRTVSDLYRRAAIYFCVCYTLALYGRHLGRRVLLGH